MHYPLFTLSTTRSFLSAFDEADILRRALGEAGIQQPTGESSIGYHSTTSKSHGPTASGATATGSAASKVGPAPRTGAGRGVEVLSAGGDPNPPRRSDVEECDFTDDDLLALP